MPYVRKWVEPTLFLEHKGVKVYHAYKPGRDWPMHFWFALSPDKGAPWFDVRDLSTWPKKKDKGFEPDIDRKPPLVAAIESGEIHRAKMVPSEED